MSVTVPERIHVRFMNGDELYVDGGLMLVELKVHIANSRDRFAPEVKLLCAASGRLLEDDGAKDIPATVDVALLSLDYDGELWRAAMRSHARAADLIGARRIMGAIKNCRAAERVLNDIFLEALGSKQQPGDKASQSMQRALKNTYMELFSTLPSITALRD